MAEYDLELRMQLLGERIERSREESERKWQQTEEEYAILRQLQAEGMRETFALRELCADLNAASRRHDQQLDRLEAKIDATFDKLDAKLDATFGKLDAKLDATFGKLDATIDRLSAETAASFALHDQALTRLEVFAASHSVDPEAHRKFRESFGLP